MPGRLLTTLARVAPSQLPSQNPTKPTVVPVAPCRSPLFSIKERAKSEDSLVMDLIHRKKRESYRKSLRLDPQRAASIDMSIESPPIVFYNCPQTSTGALFSAQLKLVVQEPSVSIDSLETVLLAITSTKKPVAQHCPDCCCQSTPIHTWHFLTHSTSLRLGSHSFPFSSLLPGHLPATTHGEIASLDYYLSVVATTSSGEKITYRHCLDIKRAISPGNEKHSTRIFPPTNLTASVTLPPVIHPIGDFPIAMRVCGVTENRDGSRYRWKLRKLNWRIEETQTFVAPACVKHVSKVGGEGKGILHEGVRNIANEEVKTGWKNDFDKGEIDVEFRIACNFGLNPLCDMTSQDGMTIKHNLVIEMVVAEEWAPSKKPTQYAPTGTARVLRTQFTLVLTERAGMGIAWDEEQPPVYEDVPASPPTYAHMLEISGSECSSRSASFSFESCTAK